MKRRALVTGGNRGIGKAIAKALVGEGLDVLIGVRDMDAGAAVAREIGARAVHCDLGPDAYLPAEADEVHVLVNNAGVLYDEPLFDGAAKFDETLEVTLHGPYHLMRRTLPFMTREGYGRIVNLSSGWGSFHEGLGGPGAYGIAKAALNALTVAAAREVTDCVKVNAMDPGWVRTRMGGPNANVSPEKAAETALWLATLPEDGPSGGFFRHKRPVKW